MLDQNYISQDEYNAALNDDVYSRIQAAQLENTEEEVLFTRISKMRLPIRSSAT